MFEKSLELFDRAQRVMPGGVNSPVRSFSHVGGYPLFIRRAKGQYLFDEDGHAYLDYVSSWGSMILGHSFQPVVEAIRRRVADAISFGAPTETEIEMAELVHSMVPSVEMIRMTNSGTEACMSVIRLARGFTGRPKIIRFRGSYHGHADGLQQEGGGGLALQDHIHGVPEGTSSDTLMASYNDLNEVNLLVDQYAGQIAAIIVEPVATNMGCIPPLPGFLEGLRHICDTEDILLIFDEVITGFRLAAGGAQQHFNVRADLVAYGKIIGGGLPAGAFGGREEIMSHVAPMGKVYQAGALSGHPLSMTAGLCVLKELKEDPVIYEQLEFKGAYLERQLRDVFKNAGVAVQINRCGSMLSLHFSDQPIVDFRTATAQDQKRFRQFFHRMLEQGIYLPPSPFGTWFISNTMTREDLEITVKAAVNRDSRIG